MQINENLELKCAKILIILKFIKFIVRRLTPFHTKNTLVMLRLRIVFITYA